MCRYSSSRATRGSRRYSSRVGRTFSGEATADPVALDLVLQDARGVRITARGCLVYAVDRDADVLDAATEKHVVLMQDEPMVHVEVVDELAELRRLLVVGEFDNFMCMCMCAGDLALEFLDSDGERVTVVRFDKPGWVDWPLWPGRARVRDVEALQGWLRARGVDTAYVVDRDG